MEPIRSLHNPSVVEAGRLHRVRERRKAQRTLIEGPEVVADAVASSIRIHATFALDGDARAGEWPNLAVVDEGVMRKLAGTQTPRGPVAVVSIPPPEPLPEDRDVLLLWGVSDPGNVGTVIRSAAAFGLGVAVGPDTADPWAPKVMRAGAGAHFRLPIAYVTSLEDLEGRSLAATVTSGGVGARSLPEGRWVVAIGSEAHGLAAEVVAGADHRVTIPMPGGGESLNAGVAASIIAYELSNRSGGGAGPH